MFRKGMGGKRLSVQWCQHSFNEGCGGHKSDGLPLLLGFLGSHGLDMMGLAHPIYFRRFPSSRIFPRSFLSISQLSPEEST